ncbi:helix-turn-helix domain-containing protein [Hoeflea sp.]|uniref:helix-turn-helix domain-containing protein n=1 Tax=Hoeflea sp. TaxID=1940281 RepID=UPI0019AEDC04|nr:helix-turn-helix domain-containing protein [Hoeflea sp.]MBC7282293.1 helix-turn-helix domain-containing protein [Hoeflea sp.]
MNTDAVAVKENDRPFMRFSTAAFAPEDGFDAYRTLYAGGSDVSRLGSGFGAQLEVRPLGDVVIFQRWLNDVAHERSSQRIRQDDFEHFVVQMPLTGSLVTQTPDGVQVVKPGEIIFFDARRPYHTRSNGVHLLTFSVARYLVERAFAASEDLHGRILAAGQSAILGDFMGSLTRHAGSLAGTGLSDSLNVFSDLLAMTLRQSEKLDDVSESMRDKLHLARRVIEDELYRPDLNPDLIAARVGMSRSRLYELFRQFGGVASYIQLRRAHRFRVLLSHARDVRSMAELAFACGFASESHASRTFRDAFGIPPGRFRKRQALDVSPSRRMGFEQNGGFNAWIASLGPRTRTGRA